MTDHPSPMVEGEQLYRCLVVDSGPIIRLTGVSTLWKKAKSFYTVPAVLQEIRDAKARQHLENLPFDLIAKEPSAEATKAIIEFSRKTGDYQSLSSVDIQVLALVYDLEKEGCCGHMDHIRTTPKRTVGIGKIEMLAGESKEPEIEVVDDDDEEDEDDNGISHDEALVTSSPPNQVEQGVAQTKETGPPKSWAALLGGNAAISVSSTQPVNVAEENVQVSFGQMKISSDASADQFGDADEEGEEKTEDNETMSQAAGKSTEEELQLDFPSLSAAVTVPYEGSDDELDPEERKKRSLQPVSKSGKLYQKDRIVKKLSKPSKSKKKDMPAESDLETPVVEENGPELAERNNQSRIMGGMNLAGQEADVEDDGEGWITTTSEIQTMKANGALDPMKNGVGPSGTRSVLENGPPMSDRTACTTTDFAMQNVILQMNLELLSVDGMKIKKLKSWVHRCGACFKVYTNAEDTGPLKGKRLFCEKCGSDMIQRIACSVDSKSGRLRLHLSKKYKHNLRGTKFSLPKPGSGDRFQGDLLLREDQLLMGSWNQKAKMQGGGKAKAASESIFGRDIAKNVGCHVNAIGDDLQVGFGRRNPNAAKGRERRGKKKKSSSKACGLRRY